MSTELAKSIKIEDKTILDKWVEATEERYQARKLITKAEMINAQAQHHITQFWDMVSKKHGINVRTGAWDYNEETQLVTPMKAGGHPLQRIINGLPPGAVVVQTDGTVAPDNTGTVVV